MSISTEGFDIQKGSQSLRSAVELLSSMRFAIALLAAISIASVVGTVVLQNEPINNYIIQFGPFWYEVFRVLGLYTVYSAWWYILMLAILVISTSLCIMRTTPKILVDIRQYKENIREQSLKAFPFKAQAELQEEPEAAARRIGGVLVASGWKVRLQKRVSASGGEGWMVAAKTGAANKLGYIAVHSAIVLICVGALLDGPMMVRAAMLLTGTTPLVDGEGLIRDVPDEHRLSDRTPAFRGNLLVNPGATAGTAILLHPRGMVLQELPFDIELKQFIVEYHSTGEPSLFASEILIHDRYTGETRAERVEVNHPVTHRGVTIYQSSFDDGGSRLNLRAVPMGQAANPFLVQGRVGEHTYLTRGDQRMRLEFTALRVINVENFADIAGAEEEAQRVGLREQITGRLGSGHRTFTERELRNVGPSVTYILRDEAGQAQEFHNYMFPIDLDGNRVFVFGVRDTPQDDFRYLRLPVDENDQIDGFIRLRTALADPELRREAVRRYVAEAAKGQRPELKDALTASSQRAIDLFAGQDPEMGRLPQGAAPVLGGLQAVSAFMEMNVPEGDRERAGEVVLRILNGTLYELLQLSREREGLARLERNDQLAQFLMLSVLSLSDSFFYPAPLVLLLEGFDHIQASVFQVARAPGASVVYFGCLLLVIGLFAMLYIRERRVWVWLSPKAEGPGLQALMALSSNRQLLANDKEFDQLKSRLLLTDPEGKT
jgi:cytochrome c biogenesis protein